ncbi:Variant-specific surface protein [Giardia duodenalis]|uniref:Variant-specific surface protein n=1 Tax=Giardia intestinalis TaxID=5741 RepID=V6TZL6_GIAIN|nr:Variant-specific surface protein [Giardia intestinalis]
MLVTYLAVGALAIECQSGEAAAANCESTKCESVGDTQICASCEANYVPINGRCQNAESSKDKCTNADNANAATQVCGKCVGQTFMFKGGCYEATVSPGKTMCKTAEGGKCTAAVETKEYFVPPGVDASHDSVVSCGDTAGVTFGSGSNTKTYKGVTGCAKCAAPDAITDTTGTKAATCIECATGFLHTSSGEASSCVETCPEGYFGHTDSNSKKTCQSCSGTNDNLDPAGTGVDGCAACTYDSAKITCTKCETGKYLKTTSDSTSCVEASGCGSGFFPKADDKAGNKCVACSSASDGGIADCSECSLLPSASGSSTPLVTCTKCSTKKLSPLGDACLDGCPAGTYNDNNICKPCHTSCTECNSNANQDSCTACYPGSVLNRTTDSGSTGTCIPECTGRYAENCEANQCTAVLGGSKYCSKCKSGFVPVDGLCVSATARAPTGCTPGDGVCSSCTGTYFLESGGCYQSTAYPGKTLCSQAANGQCSQCANGQTQSNGVCPTCDPTCATCETGKPQECKTCFSGYYLDSIAKACKKCSENSADGIIQGVKDCVSCAPPTGNSGTVTCYVTQEPSVNPTDPSVNKGGLSSGAIAGISVAVIAVVGGLVGFFCRR